jgi:NitT/TauT family transport system substrate-binding protein
MKRRDILKLASALPIIALSRPARAEAINFLLPAATFLPVFAPHQLAKARGYFTQNGVEVTFLAGRGGSDVAKQVAVGNADIGGATGELVVVVRANGLPVRNVALLGGRPLFSVAFRRAVGATSAGDLRGRKIGVVSYTDGSYYDLLGVMAASKLTKSDLHIESVGSAGVRELMISGDLDVAMLLPEDLTAIEDAGVKLDRFSIASLFPGMAQTVIASDKIIQTRPDMVHGVVKAMLQSIQSIIDDPAAAARDYVRAIPQNADRQNLIERSMRLYGDLVYKPVGGMKLGAFDPAKIETLQSALYAFQIIQNTSPVGDLYTNQFVD